MLLKLGDSGDAVKALQRGLNRLGSLLLVDGGFGPTTRDAVVDGRLSLELPGPPEADDGFQDVLAAVADPFPPLTAAGVTFIARAEVAGPAEYRARYGSPVWPGGQSGITIGIGYDLRFADRGRLTADWGNQLTSEALARLAPSCGQLGSPALCDQVRDVKVPLLAAVTVFLRRTLPRTLDQTRVIWPQVDGLEAPRRTALVSVVYNRGNGLRDTDPARQNRREMREIRGLLAAGRMDGVAAQIESMARLWDPVRERGLIERRRAEATLWRLGFAALQLD
jgi:putative peptidoglycan binding protein